VKISGLVPGSTHYFSVQSVHRGGAESPSSETLTVEIPGTCSDNGGGGGGATVTTAQNPHITTVGGVGGSETTPTSLPDTDEYGSTAFTTAFVRTTEFVDRTAAESTENPGVRDDGAATANTSTLPPQNTGCNGTSVAQLTNNDAGASQATLLPTSSCSQVPVIAASVVGVVAIILVIVLAYVYERLFC
jgi:hypothetical protein